MVSGDALFCGGSTDSRYARALDSGRDLRRKTWPGRRAGRRLDADFLIYFCGLPGDPIAYAELFPYI